jgi:hypothetical protein
MCRYIVRSVLLVCLWTVATQPVLAESGQDNVNCEPQFVLEQIQKRLGTISNYQCTQVTTLMRSNQGNPNQPVVATTERKHVARDSQRRGRIREVYDNLGAISTIWDGTRTIEVHERAKPNGTVVNSAWILPGRCLRSTRGEVPWSCLGGTLVKLFARALKDGTKISIEPTEDGHCRLEIPIAYGTIRATILDPKRGYLPIRTEMITQGELRRYSDVEFREVDPGIWFPSAVWTSRGPRRMHPSGPPIPKERFTDVKINDRDFDRCLVPDLPEGSTVADEVCGVRYVVDYKSALDIAGNASSSLVAGEAARADGSNLNTQQGALETVYSLEANQALKRIAPPFPPARRQSIINHEPDQSHVPEATLLNRTYVFGWDGDLKQEVSLADTGFLKLSEILQYVCGLDIAEYSGSENLLDLRLAGDWIVRRNASDDECLHALESIVYDETGVNIAFEKRRVDTLVVRATGILRYHSLPGALGENDVQLFAERSGSHFGSYVGGGSGRLAQLLRHMADRTGRRFVDETLSSSMEVSWSDYTSSKLDPLKQVRQVYRYELAGLLENVTRQTGLTFTTERRKIDEWLVRIGP